MSTKQIEGQQSLHCFLTSSVDKHTENTPDIEINPKKRTPPSLEGQSQKKINTETSPNQIEPQESLFLKEAEDMSRKEEDPKSPVIKDDEPLPQKTIDCMKVAMQELINPLEEKINQLIGTKEKQEEQEEEIIQLKLQQSELYRKCMKTEVENTKLKRRLEILESKMLEANLIIHGLREEEWEDEMSRRERIYRGIAPTVDADDRTERLHTARSIPIRFTKCLGKYK